MPGRITIEDANIVTAPELRFTPSGTAVVNFRIAINKRTKNASGDWEKGDSTFLGCVAWKQRAERIAEEDLQPGEAIFATGILEGRQYETKDGEKRTSFEVTLDAFGRDYKWVSDKKPAQKAASYDYAPPF